MFGNIIGDIQHNLLVKPTHILLEQDLTDGETRKVWRCGALNFKPENTRTKVSDYINKIFMGTFCNSDSVLERIFNCDAAKLGVWCSQIVIGWGLSRPLHLKKILGSVGEIRVVLLVNFPKW